MTEALIKLAEGLDWQDIETAPLNKRVLFYERKGVVDVRERIVIGIKSSRDGDVWTDDGNDLNGFTHWMPLPTGNTGEIIRVLVEGLEYFRDTHSSCYNAFAGKSIAEEYLTKANQLAGGDDE